MLTTEFQYQIGSTIRRLMDRVARADGPAQAKTVEDAKDRLDEAIIALIRARVALDD